MSLGMEAAFCVRPPPTYRLLIASPMCGDAYGYMITNPHIIFGSSGLTTEQQSETALMSMVNRKILVIDDDEAILTTYRSILQPRITGIESLFSLLGENHPGLRESFEVITAPQGQLGVEQVRAALAQNSPFSVAFVDMRMPPGWDGLRTAQALRTLDPNLYIVVASAYADYTADQIQAALARDAVLLRKPFGRDEVYQLARTLAQGWSNRRALQDLNRALEVRMTRAIYESEALFNALAIALPLGIMRTDVAGNCINVNDQAATICGRTMMECLGTSWSTYLHPEDRDRVWQGWQAVSATQTIFRDTYRFCHDDGTEVWVLGTTIPQYNEVGVVIGLVGTLLDITELKTTQAALRCAQDALGKSI